MTKEHVNIAKHILFGQLVQNYKNLTEIERQLGRTLLEDEDIKDTLFLIKRNKALLN